MSTARRSDAMVKLGREEEVDGWLQKGSLASGTTKAMQLFTLLISACSCLSKWIISARNSLLKRVLSNILYLDGWEVRGCLNHGLLLPFFALRGLSSMKSFDSHSMAQFSWEIQRQIRQRLVNFSNCLKALQVFLGSLNELCKQSPSWWMATTHWRRSTDSL